VVLRSKIPRKDSKCKHIVDFMGLSPIEDQEEKD